jgi:hypothetical protein
MENKLIFQPFQTFHEEALDMTATSIFISYSHKDEYWLLRLQQYLLALKEREMCLAPWSDKEIGPGDEWRAKILKAMTEANLAVLLVSVNFLTSDFIKDVEMPFLLERKTDGALRKIMPLIVEPCGWKHHPALAGLEVRPKVRDSLLKGNDYEQKEDLNAFAEEILKVIREGPPLSVHPGSSATPLVPPGALPYLGTDCPTLELHLTHCEWNWYRAELKISHLRHVEEDKPLRYFSTFDLRHLLRLRNDDGFAAALWANVFAEVSLPAIKAAGEAARNRDNALRIRLCVDPSARELHHLPWELLTELTDGDNSLASDDIRFFRYTAADSEHWRDVELRPKAPLSALLMVGALTEAGGSSFSDFKELERSLASARAILEGSEISCSICDRFCTKDRIAEELRRNDGADFVYLLVTDELPVVDVETMTLTGEAVCGKTRNTNALASAIDKLFKPPRLIVMVPSPLLFSSVQADSSPNPKWGMAHLAHDVANAGVAGVLTLQRPMEKNRWEGFLTAFISVVSRDGRMDGAMTEARKAMAVGADRFAPVLVSRFKTARLWYVPGFMDVSRTETTWMDLLRAIEDRRCTPIIGSGVNLSIYRSRRELAMRWADKYEYPMATHERINLPQVAQYVATYFGDNTLCDGFTKDMREYVREKYGDLLTPSERSQELYEMLSAVAEMALDRDPDESHNILAALPFPVYLSANLNSFLAIALKRKHRDPVEEVFPLLDEDRSQSKIKRLKGEPTIDRPLVYHFFGTLRDIRSAVLTEDDHFQFLTTFWRNKELVPRRILSALTNSSLLFLGFKIHQWDFRVLLRTFVSLEGVQLLRTHTHVAVQVDPDDNQIQDPDRARQYIEEYLKRIPNSNISIFWGSAEDFLADLYRRWQGRRP